MSEIDWLLVLYEFVFFSVGTQICLEYFFGDLRVSTRRPVVRPARSVT